jgi:hypothetical protein
LMMNLADGMGVDLFRTKPAVNERNADCLLNSDELQAEYTVIISIPGMLLSESNWMFMLRLIAIIFYPDLPPPSYS